MTSLRLSPLADVAPIGGFVRYPGNPVITSIKCLPENIVFDPVTNKYYSPMTNFSSGNVGLLSSVDCLIWTVENPTLVVTGDSQGSPHLLLDEGTWYLYYAKAVAGHTDIYLATAGSPNGLYTLIPTPVMTHGSAAWDRDRALEPFVFMDLTGRWVMLYMGDANQAFPTETVGYATATSPIGPFTRYAGNPVIGAGAPGTYDYGGAADPSVYVFNGVYYIYYACMPNPPTQVQQLNPGSNGYCTSTDLVTFTRHGTALTASGVKGTPDEWGTIRGGVIRKDDNYYYIYAGRSASSVPPTDYTACVATLPAKAPNFLINA
jgi:Glycosyl hydrolases family 32 N-terminal domain